MFKKILYFCDENGKPLEKPRALELNDVNAKRFTVMSCNERESSIVVSREAKSSKNDMYNDDGRPATTLTRIVLPYIMFMDNYVEVTGFESPGLVLAGLASESYEERERHMYPKKGEKLTQDAIWMRIRHRRYADTRDMKNLFAQKIILFS